MMYTLAAPLVAHLVLAAAAPAAPSAPALELAAATPYWPAPERAKKAKKARPRSDDGAQSKSTDKLEDEVFDDGSSKSRSSSKSKATAKARSRDEDDEAEDGGDDDEQETASVRRRSRPLRQDDDETITPSLPVVATHVVSFGLGGSLMGRRFQFDTALQQEKTFPRPGAVAALELYPLMLAGTDWFTRFGVGASFEREFGSAGLSQADGGTLEYGITEERWSVDVRYAYAAGERWVLVPRVGFGHSGYDVQRKTETTPPSMCTANATSVCLPDVTYSHFVLGAEARVAFTPSFGMWLGAAFLPAFGVGRAPGQLGVENAPASSIGFGGSLGATWQLGEWLALQASIPVSRTNFVIDGPNNAYRSASEMYYGLVVGAVVWAK
jgi:hypothetical protein